jgi:hypothetical protein
MMTTGSHPFAAITSKLAFAQAFTRTSVQLHDESHAQQVVAARARSRRRLAPARHR